MLSSNAFPITQLAMMFNAHVEKQRFEEVPTLARKYPLLLEEGFLMPCRDTHHLILV